jgi:hypothetical protein
MRKILIPLVLAVSAVVSSTAQTPAQAPPALTPPLSFVPHTIDTGMKGGYQVIVTDLNRDRKPDVVALAIGLNQLRWYDNPGWQSHVIADNLSSMINAAAFDTDGDGIDELAIAYEFSTVYERSKGVIAILTHGADPAAPWTMKEIDRVPTTHRLRFADPEGNGRKVLVNAPLIGPAAVTPQFRDKVSLFWYRPGDWTRQVVTDADEGVVHGLLPSRWRDGKKEAVLSASFLGVHLMEFEQGRWTRTRLTSGDPGEWPKSGSSDVAAVRLGNEIALATIEPWHGNQLVTYRQRNGSWLRSVNDASIVDAHTIVAGDLDGDGRDEIVVGERQGRRSTYVYRADQSGDVWSRQVLDDGDMSGAGCAIADMNGDGRADIVCIGTATANLKWYENAGKPAAAATR